MKKSFLLFTLLFSVCLFSQNVTDYKYIVVPVKFGFLKEANKYNLNALTKSVLEKQGYEVYYDNEILPQDLAENRCKALYADMLENNNLLTTKIKLELKDCKNQVVYVSDQGVSRQKELVKAYVQAFRQVGKSVETLKSNPKPQIKDVVTQSKKEVAEESIGFQLFAQPITNGFQLVDSTPKVVMKLFKTSIDNFYIGQKDSQQGIVFNKNNQWHFEYYQNDKLVTEKMEIKF
ncbi:hypothetical protein FSS13T_23310 [Flavobacterium saliperosum S13]|uniref:Secreted protein n=2 Tax=Flavobacterium saliperosum TaxID=329186 RepID=A0A1G4VPN3_9FLAO|nr:hypothetical protein [Flavobacterium saliperosum]ESU23602.1 hypothetical protein FSS13T_23310 [Flavobacterium saliperosum S13]SCX09268.1 hypothetical protein SAMN02927925_01361 [Flavobacterium saliperosum]